MTTLDRYIVRQLGVDYAIALTVMMSLYVVLDLFFNIDEFTEVSSSWTAVLGDIASYYGSHAFLYFSQLSGVITLFACLTTLARMRRGNELTAVLSSGVSLYRVAVPIVVFGLGTSLLWYVDTETILPRLAHHLARSHEDARGRAARGIWFVRDGETALLSAMEFVPARGWMRQPLVLFRDENGRATRLLEAQEASWKAVEGHPAGGVWRLEQGLERRLDAVSGDSIRPSDVPDTSAVEYYESRLGPRSIEARQAQQWLKFSSTRELSRLADEDPTLVGRVRQVRHSRFATPLVHMLMLLLGVPFFLSREPANVLADAGKCVATCGLCFLLSFSSEHFVVGTTLSALPAWLPLIAFSPVAVVLIDRIRT
ncbi:MAG: YjgP/YjgQ family permease [Phycisphaerales bacterium]|nr:YjgP/YjgQ family permease [Phycisphaerales bacterium]